MAELLTTSNASDIATYNGITFGHKTETVGVDIRPVYDTAGRAVVYNVYSFTISGPVYVSGGVSDTTMPGIIRALTQPAGEFRYENKGLGTSFRINIPGGGGTRDVIWGPKPQLLRSKPIGTALWVTWQVEVAIANCPEVDARFRVMEFNYRLNYDGDASDYWRRTYSGHVRIPQTRRRVNDRSLSDTADAYRDLINPACPPGFRRVSRSFPLSEDKCRLDFTIVDEQMPLNIPPDGIVHAQARHSVSAGKFLAPTSLWNGTISASYEVGRQYPKEWALGWFLQLLDERLTYIRRHAQNVLKGVNAGKPHVLVHSFQMDEPEIYGRQTASFSAGYTTLMDRAEVLTRGGSGLWQPLGSSNWLKWAASMKDSLLSTRGLAGLRHFPTDDVIIDLCDDRRPRFGQIVARDKKKRPDNRGKIISNEYPGDRNSYIRYRTRIKLGLIDDVVELKPLPGAGVAGGTVTGSASGGAGITPKPLPGAGAVPAGGELLGQGGNFLGMVPKAVLDSLPPPGQPGAKPETPLPGTGDDPPSIQTRCRPTVEIILEGHAVRAGYPVVPPTLVSVGGYKAIPANRPGNGFVQEVATSWFGVPILVGYWNFRWLVEGVLQGQLPIPTNVMTD